MRRVITFVHIKWHWYTNYIFSYKMCLVPYFIWVSWYIKSHWNTKFAIQNKLWPSNIFHFKLFFNQWISRALQEFWSSLYYYHKKLIITNSFSMMDKCHSHISHLEIFTKIIIQHAFLIVCIYIKRLIHFIKSSL